MAPSCVKRNALSFWHKLVHEQKDCIYPSIVCIYTVESSYQYVVVTEETEYLYPLLLRHSLKLPKSSTINSYLSAVYDER